MLRQVSSFLASHWDGKSPLLLGYSGGSDSKALLYALLEVGCRSIYLAHVDHGWRESSADEANQLREEAELLALPFYSTRLTPPVKNKEAHARQERLAFFQSFSSVQAILLAHHADDLAETVLKRALEGAHLPFLGGMESVSHQIWRPLLSVSKKEILSFLMERDLHPIIDPTNKDPAYLRSRMRTDILPMLEQQFGKAIVDNLLHLSKRSYELKRYLDRKIEHIPSYSGPCGTFYPLSQLDRIEARHFLQKKLTISRPLLESILDAIFSLQPNHLCTPSLVADRGFLFFLAPEFPKCGDVALDLVPGVHYWGDWTVRVEEGGSPYVPDWKMVWSGQFTACLPAGALIQPLPGMGLGKLWNEAQVPAFLRNLAPVFQGISGVQELLSGRGEKSLLEKGPFFTLSFSTG